MHNDDKIPWILLGAAGTIFTIAKCVFRKKRVVQHIDRIIYVEKYIFPNM